jgi:hypothetical protein
MNENQYTEELVGSAIFCWVSIHGSVGERNLPLLCLGEHLAEIVVTDSKVRASSVRTRHHHRSSV